MYTYCQYRNVHIHKHVRDSCPSYSDTQVAMYMYGKVVDCKRLYQKPSRKIVGDYHRSGGFYARIPHIYSTTYYYCTEVEGNWSRHYLITKWNTTSMYIARFPMDYNIGIRYMNVSTHACVALTLSCQYDVCVCTRACVLLTLCC